MIFGLLLEIFPNASMPICSVVYLVSAIAMLVPVYRFEFWPVFIAFLVLEGMLGMFNSCGATLRSIYYPESAQASIMSVFRFPLNVLVVTGTLLTDKANDARSLQFVFVVVFGMHIVAFLLQLSLYMVTSNKPIEIDKKMK